MAETIIILILLALVAVLGLCLRLRTKNLRSVEDNYSRAVQRNAKLEIFKSAMGILEQHARMALEQNAGNWACTFRTLDDKVLARSKGQPDILTAIVAAQGNVVPSARVVSGSGTASPARKGGE